MIDLKKIFVIRLIVLVLIMLTVFLGLEVSANGFYTYGYDRNGKAVEAPPAVECEFAITGLTAGAGDFKNAQDMFLDVDGTIYLADTGNNRILILNSNGEVKKQITEFTDTSTDRIQTFNNPKGVFVTPKKEIYVCDTDNGRIVHLDSNGLHIRSIVFKTADTLPDDFTFKPIKIALDSSGRIFVVSQGFNNGLLEFTKDGEYTQYMGASRVALTASQLFWRAFQTKEQRAKTSSNVSTEYSNVEIDEQGFLLVTTSSYEYWQYKQNKIQAVRKLNAKGSDVLVRVGDPKGDIEFPDEKISRSSYKGPSTLVDVCTLPYGNYAVLDQKRGRVFAYNSEGEMMYNFGGPGDFNGGMLVPTALDYFDGRFYVVDSAKNQINVYSVTDYGKLFETVSKAQSEIDYSTEEKLWNKIIKENANCELAMRGLGIAAYRKQEMKTAMQYFYKAGDRENYSKAFVFERRQWIEENAVILVLVSVLVIFSVVFFKRLWKRRVLKSDRYSYITQLDYAGYVAFHPIKGFWELKREKRGGLAAAFTFLGLTCGVRIFAALFSGFLFNNRDLDTYNVITDIGFVIVAVFLWCISQWCVTVLMSGEATFKEIFIATSYSLMPFFWLNLFATIMSRFLSLDEGEFYTVIIAFSFIYLAFLMIMSVMSLHDYSMRKTLLVILIILIVILLVIFVVLLLLSLSGQMISFVTDFYNEITLRL